MENVSQPREGVMVKLVREHKKALLAVYRTVVILLAVAAAVYALRYKLFVGEEDVSKSLTVIDLLLAPNSTRPFGVPNLELILPTLLYLLPCGYMCFMSFMSAYRRFHVLYVPHDEEHCATYRDTRRLKLNITVYLYTMLAGVITGFVQVQGVTYRLSGLAFGLFLFASAGLLWEFAAGYVLSDGVAKTVYYKTHEKVSAMPPRSWNRYSLYHPDNMVEKGVRFYIYIGCLLGCSLLGLTLLLCLPLYRVEQFGVEVERMALVDYIGDANHMMQSLLAGGGPDAEWLMGVLSNCRSLLMVIGWFVVMVYLVVKLIPYYILTAVYGMTYQDKKTIQSFTTFMLYVSAGLWFMTTAEVIELYALEVGAGIAACRTSLIWFILCIVMRIVVSVLGGQLRYRTDDRQEKTETGYAYADLVEVFAGSQYYIRAFSYGIYWNFSAFFLGHIWMAYRKMYGGAVLFYFVQTLASSLAIASLSTGKVLEGLLAFLAVPMFMGLFGNLLYRGHVERHINKALVDYHPALQLEYISGKGGVSIAAVVVLSILQGLASFVGMAALFS